VDFSFLMIGAEITDILYYGNPRPSLPVGFGPIRFSIIYKWAVAEALYLQLSLIKIPAGLLAGGDFCVFSSVVH
jgi:hypothetical protein